MKAQPLSQQRRSLGFYADFERNDASLIKLFRGVMTLTSNFLEDEPKTFECSEDKIC